MKPFLTIAVLLAAFTAAALTNPVNNGVLTTPLNANGQAITNVTRLVTTDGVDLVPLARVAAPAATVTNFSIANLSGAGYAAANGQYGNFDWNDIVNGNCTAPNGNLYIIGGGATNNSVALTTNILEIDDYSGGGVNIYYATNFSTNAAQIVWFAAATNYLPVPSSLPFTFTNLVIGLGPVPVAQVSTQIQSAILTGGTNLEAALAGLNHPPAFSGAGLTNLPSSGPEIWAYNRPYFIIYVAPYNLNTETQVTNCINTLVKMPQFANLTNAGFGWMMLMDVNASNRRNTNGVLQWSYYLYPDGPSWLTQYCASNGIESGFGIYGDTTVHLPPGDNGGVCSVSGGGQNSVVFYADTGLSFGTNYSDCTLPEQIPGDLATISGWGFGTVMVNDLGAGVTWQQQQQLQGEVSSVCDSIRNIATGRPMGFIAFDTPPSGTFGQSMGNYTRTLHSAIVYDQAQGDAETFLRTYSLDYAGCPSAANGAWQVNNIFNSPEPQMTVYALISSWICPRWGSAEIDNLTNEPCLTMATNALWQAIELDAGHALPALVQDLGTNGSVWTKPMAGGRFAVGIFNGGGNGSNITVNLPTLAQSGMTYAVTNVWTGGYLGTFGSSLVASNLTARGSSNSAALWLCTPRTGGITGTFALTNGTSLYVTNGLIMANH